MKDGVAREAEEVHEQRADQEALQETDEDWGHPVFGQTNKVRNIMKQHVHNQCIGKSDKCNTKQLENESDRANGSEAEGVLDHKEEAVPGRCTEIFGGQRNLMKKK